MEFSFSNDGVTGPIISKVVDGMGVMARDRASGYILISLLASREGSDMLGGRSNESMLVWNAILRAFGGSAAEVDVGVESAG